MALIKTIKFSNEVLEILKAMTWSNDGTRGKLNGQLDRKMYLEVNKALDAMGGKWNRKEGAHVFLLDPRSQVEGLLESGNLVVERDGFFQTPDAVIDRMFELVPLDESVFVLEPSAGLGAIARRLIGCNLTLVEKNTQRCEELRKEFKNVLCIDFMELPEPKCSGNYYGRIYMNPPFEELQDIDHVMHAHEMLEKNGKLVSVMGEGAFFRQDKKSVAFREWLESVGGYSEKLPEGSFKESGTGVNSRLVIVDRV